MHKYMGMVFFINFVVDFLLLLGTNRLLGVPSGYLRCAVSALLGGVYAASCLLPGFSFLGNLLWRMVSLSLMGILAFGCDKSAFQRCCCFFLLSIALGGITLSTGREDLRSMLLCAVGILALCWAGFGKGMGKQEYQILKLKLGEKSVSLLALQDTGNTLRDPVSGESVVVISPKAAYTLTGLTQSELFSPLETLTRRPLQGLRLIPYHAVGTGGMLLGMRIRDAELDGKKKSLLVAFAPDGLGTGEVYQALTGGAL